MCFPPLWLTRCLLRFTGGKSRVKLRRFGARHKGGPGEFAASAPRGNSPGICRKMDKDKYQLAPLASPPRSEAPGFGGLTSMGQRDNQDGETKMSISMRTVAAAAIVAAGLAGAGTAS